MRNKVFINSFELVRIFVCAIIILFHLEGDLISEQLINNEYRFFSFGKESIGFFFAISGFLTSLKILKKGSIENHFVTRLIRIYPTYLFVGTLYMIMRVFFNSFDQIGIVHYTNTIFLSFGQRGVNSFVYVGWTLFYEIIFYLFIYLFRNQFKKIMESKYSYLILILSSIILYILNLHYFIYFILGIICFASFYKEKSMKNLKKIFLISFSLFLLKFLGIYYFTTFCILLLLISLEFSGVNFKNRWILFFSKATYSMYLIQVLTLPFSIKLIKFIAKFDIDIFSSNRLFFYIFGLFLTMICGIGLFRIIESPLSNFLQKRLR